MRVGLIALRRASCVAACRLLGLGLGFASRTLPMASCVAAWRLSACSAASASSTTSFSSVQRLPLRSSRATRLSVLDENHEVSSSERRGGEGGREGEGERVGWGWGWG